jgi:signal peptidase II
LGGDRVRGEALLLVAAALLADWVTKGWALHLLGGDVVALPLAPLSLEVARNDAFVLSAGAGALSPTLVVSVRLLGLLLILSLLSRADGLSRRSILGVALLVAGGLGNAADLIFREGAVVDFISTGVLSFPFQGQYVHFGLVFNLADVWILAGVVLLWPLFRQVGLRVRRRLARLEGRVLARLRGPAARRSLAPLLASLRQRR